MYLKKYFFCSSGARMKKLCLPFLNGKETVLANLERNFDLSSTTSQQCKNFWPFSQALSPYEGTDEDAGKRSKFSKNEAISAHLENNFGSLPHPHEGVEKGGEERSKFFSWEKGQNFPHPHEDVRVWKRVGE